MTRVGTAQMSLARVAFVLPEAPRVAALPMLAPEQPFAQVRWLPEPRWLPELRLLPEGVQGTEWIEPAMAEPAGARAAVRRTWVHPASPRRGPLQGSPHCSPRYASAWDLR